MTNKFTQFFKPLHKTRLTDAERAAMRADFIAYMRAHPYMRTRAENPLQTIAFFLFKKPVAIALCLSLVIFSAGSVVYAANDALPGETLYTIKVDVNEEFSSAFLSREKKARFEIERAARRIQEATELALQNRLTSKTARMIETRIEKHAQTISELAANISAEGDVKASADIYTKFQATLAANEEIFTSVVEEESIEGTQTLVATIEMIEEAAKSETTNAVITLVQNNEVQEDELAELAEEAKVEVEQVSFTVEQTIEAAPSTTSPIARKLAAVQTIKEEGERRLEKGDVKESVALFQEAKTRAKEAEAFIKTSEKQPSLAARKPEQTAPTPKLIENATNLDTPAETPSTPQKTQQTQNTPQETTAATPAEPPQSTQTTINQSRFNTSPKIISYPSIPIGAPQNEIRFIWEAFDPENDTLQWEIWWGDRGEREAKTICEAPSCSRISASHAFEDQGLYTVRVRVDDGKGKSDGYSFTIDIRATETSSTNDEISVKEQTSAQELIAPSDGKEREKITPIRERERRR